MGRAWCLMFKTPYIPNLAPRSLIELLNHV
jgi:hypothetical protein